jgi:hypothetical protein
MEFIDLQSNPPYMALGGVYKFEIQFVKIISFRDLKKRGNLKTLRRE